MTPDISPNPESWLVVEVPLPHDEDRAAALVEELGVLGGGGVEEAHDRLRVYLPTPAGSEASVLARARSVLEADRPPFPVEFEHRWQPHEAWSDIWRRGLSPRRITKRIVVTPSWESPDLQPGDLLITIDPGMAFGTAEHATTRACLRLLDGRVRDGDRVADVGAGSGILSIGAVRLGAARVLAIEMDPHAAATAVGNCESNDVADRVDVRTERVDADCFRVGPSFDGIVANIESGVLLPLLEAFRAGLARGGWLILSGILEEEAEGIVEAARSVGLELESDDREGRWWAGAFRPGEYGALDR